MGYLIDTCIWVDVERRTIAPADVAVVTGKDPVYLSPVTLAELTYGAELATDPAIRQKRLMALRRLSHKLLLRIDGVTGEVFGSLAGSSAAGDGQDRPLSGSRPLVGQPSRAAQPQATHP